MTVSHESVQGLLRVFDVFKSHEGIVLLARYAQQTNMRVACVFACINVPKNDGQRQNKADATLHSLETFALQLRCLPR